MMKQLRTIPKSSHTCHNKSLSINTVEKEAVKTESEKTGLSFSGVVRTLIRREFNLDTDYNL